MTIDDILACGKEDLAECKCYPNIKNEYGLIVLDYLKKNSLTVDCIDEEDLNSCFGEIRESLKKYGIIKEDTNFRTSLEKGRKIFEVVVQNTDKRSLLIELNKIRKELSFDDINYVMIKYEDNVEEGYYCLDREMFIFIQDFLEKNKLRNNMKIFSYDLNLSYCDGTFIQEHVMFTCLRLSAEELVLASEGKSSELELSIETGGCYYIEESDVDVIGKENLLIIAYLCLKKKLKVYFESHEHTAIFINYCTIVFSRRYLQKVDQLRFFEELSGDILVLNKSLYNDSILVSVEEQERTYQVVAVPLLELLRGVQVETIITTICTTEMEVTLDGIFNLNVILDNLLNIYKENLDHTTDLKLKSIFKEEHAYATKGEYFKDLIERLTEIARRCLKLNLVSAEEFIIFKEGDVLYFSVLSSNKSTINVTLMDIETNRKQQEVIDIGKLLPTYMYADWIGLDFNETKIGVPNMNDSELENLICINSNRKDMRRDQLIREEKFSECMMFFRNGFNEKDSNMYADLIRSNPHLDKMVKTGLDGKIQVVFSEHETT